MVGGITNRGTYYLVRSCWCYWESSVVSLKSLALCLWYLGEWWNSHGVHNEARKKKKETLGTRRWILNLTNSEKAGMGTKGWTGQTLVLVVHTSKNPGETRRDRPRSPSAGGEGNQSIYCKFKAFHFERLPSSKNSKAKPSSLHALPSCFVI